MGKDMEKTEYAIKQVGDRYYTVIIDREAGGHYEIKNPLTGGILSYNNAEAAETYIKRVRDKEQARRAYVKAEETAKRSGLEARRLAEHQRGEQGGEREEMRGGGQGAQKQRQGEEWAHDPSQAHDGDVRATSGPASPEKTLTEGALSDHGRRHLDDRGGGVRLGALPCTVGWGLEGTGPADFRECIFPDIG